MNTKENLPTTNAHSLMPNALKDVSFLELFIINTIAYFDIFDHPLTISEIYNYLYTGGMAGNEYSLLEIKQILKESRKLKKIITTKSGFYFLKNREKIIKTRQKRLDISLKKIKIALSAIKWFKYLPHIKLVAICNNLAHKNSKTKSDIDLFIITSKKRLYLVRFFLIIIISFLGLRPPRDKAKARDKLCLSFYTTEDNLDFSNLKIAENDIHFIDWLTSIQPVYQRDDYYLKFIKANNWINDYLPNFLPKMINYRFRIEDKKFNRFVYKFKEMLSNGWLGNVLERVAKYLQIKKMSQNKMDIQIREKKWIVINDKILKLHENDTRQEYLKIFEEKQKEIISKID